MTVHDISGDSNIIDLYVPVEALAYHDDGAYEHLLGHYLKHPSVAIALALTYRRAGTMRDSRYVCENYEAVSQFLTIAETVCVTDTAKVTGVDQTVFTHCAALLDTESVMRVFQTSKKISHVDFDVVFRKVACGSVKKPYTKYVIEINRSLRVGGDYYDGMDVNFSQTIATTKNDHHREHNDDDSAIVNAFE